MRPEARVTGSRVRWRPGLLPVAPLTAGGGIDSLLRGKRYRAARLWSTGGPVSVHALWWWSG